MEQFIDHDADAADVTTTAWERILSLLVGLYSSILSLFSSVWARGDYLPRLTTPNDPAYFTARKRDAATIITNLLTDEKRAAQANGETHGDGGESDNKALELSKKRGTEVVSIRSFVESRCPTMKQGASESFSVLHPPSHHSPLSLTKQSTTQPGGFESKSSPRLFLSLVLERVAWRILTHFALFFLSILSRSGHANTVYCIMGDFTKKDLVDYQRYVPPLLFGHRSPAKQCCN